jgi:hypothetical protein
MEHSFRLRLFEQIQASRDFDGVKRLSMAALFTQAMFRTNLHFIVFRLVRNCGKHLLLIWKY